MSKCKQFPLSLNGDTFNGFKSDFDQMLRNLLTEMEKRDSDEATINIKMTVGLEKSEERDFEITAYEAMKEITKPTFKHEISTVMTVKNKKSGTLGGNYKLVWDSEAHQYVMREIDDGQRSLFDDEDAAKEPVYSQVDDPTSPETVGLPSGERPSLPPVGGTVIDADYEEVDEAEGEEDEEHPGTEKVGSDGRMKPVVQSMETPYEHMKRFVGQSLRVLNGAGIYTVRSEGNEVVLSSGLNPMNLFYISEPKLKPHVGHEVSCVEYPGQIVIRCLECDETLFVLDIPNENPAEDGYEYTQPEDLEAS